MKDLVWFYGISTIVGYVMPNPFLYIYVYIRYIEFAFVWFYRISTVVSYLMQNSVYAFIVSKIGDCSGGRLEGSFFNSDYTEV